MNTNEARNHSSRQRGAALIIGLVFMLVLTVLGVSGINMATLELEMADNTQASELAFQAAETGIEVALAGPISTTRTQTYEGVPIGDGTYTFDARIACAGTTRVPDGIYSEGAGTRAIHFDVTSTGFGPRNAVSQHTQSVYIVGPGPVNASFNPAEPIGSC